MIYIFDSDLPQNKSILFSLTSIYGIGLSKANLICNKLGFSKNYKTKDLSKEQVNRLIKIIESLNISVGSDLKKSKLLIAKDLMSIKSYRGLRRNQGLPVRGQRTHTNARTSRKIR